MNKSAIHSVRDQSICHCYWHFASHLIFSFLMIVK